MNEKYDVVVFDVKGTLVIEHEHTPRTKTLVETLQNLKNKGVRLFTYSNTHTTVVPFGFPEGLLEPVTLKPTVKFVTLQDFLQRNRFDPKKVLVIGDDYEDGQAAKTAGCDSKIVDCRNPMSLETELGKIFGEDIVAKKPQSIISAPWKKEMLVVPATNAPSPKVLVIQGRNMLYDYTLEDFGDYRTSKWDVRKTSIRWWTLPKTLENLQKKGVRVFALVDDKLEQKVIVRSGLGNAISGMILEKDLDVQKICELTKTAPEDVLYVGEHDSIDTFMPKNGKLFKKAGVRCECVHSTFKHPSQDNDYYMQMFEKRLVEWYGADIRSPDLGYEILAFGNDVTLVSQGKPVSERLVSMLQRLREQGIRIFHISFDTPPAVDGLPQGLVEPAVVDCGRDEIKDRLGIDRSCVRTLLINDSSALGSKNGGRNFTSLDWMNFAKTADGKIDAEAALERVFGEVATGKKIVEAKPEPTPGLGVGQADSACPSMASTLEARNLEPELALAERAVDCIGRNLNGSTLPNPVSDLPKPTAWQRFKGLFGKQKPESGKKTPVRG